MHWDKTTIITPEKVKMEAQAPVIISASRATDIPAFYSDWFVEKIKKGYVEWRNPFNKSLIYVSFQKTRLVVFWSKNPRPIFKHLNYLEEKIKNFYFQFTLNDYDSENLEPGVSNISSRIEAFLQLSELIGKEKVIWRFDPLILTDSCGIDTLLRKVENIGNQLKNHTTKMVFSFVDINIYKKVQNNLRKNKITLHEFKENQMEQFAVGLQQLNKIWNFEIGTCSEKISLEKYKINHNKCIDDKLIIRLFPYDKPLMDYLGVKMFDFCGDATEMKNKKDNGQRRFCSCIPSKDIGRYNTCPHLCVYCYANTSQETAELKRKTFFRLR
jgi:DNA repair photolyase